MPDRLYSLCIPISLSILQIDWHERWSLSATRTGSPGRLSVNSSCLSCSFNKRVIVNFEPLPSSLSTVISPPIIWIIFCVIAMPSPVPCILLVLTSSTLENGSKIRSIYSAGIPIPLSSNINS